nr:MAG TPA: hypothetical protein [Caudoviricetes sp.]
MKNREKFSKEILDLLIKNHDIGILKTGKPCMCNETSCDLCIFCDTEGICDDTLALRYMEQEYHEPEVEWERVEMDTPIAVNGQIAHFYRYDKATGNIYAFNYGKTSYTSKISDTNPYMITHTAELIRDEDKIKFSKEIAYNGI